MNNEDTVVVNKEFFDKLCKDSDFLYCLRNAGVDNWQGYAYAQGMFSEINEEEE